MGQCREGRRKATQHRGGSMVMLPHPIVMNRLAQQRCDELVAQAERHRLGVSATSDGVPRWWRLDLAAIAGLALALALPFVASLRG